VEFSWTTFTLQVINFLVLIWLLTRFLYRPIARVLAERKATSERVTAQAQEVKAQAEAMRERYESRLADWQREKDALKNDLDAELSALRVRKRAELQATLEQERQQAQIMEDAHLRELERRVRERIAASGTEFCSRLLSRIAGPEVEARLVDVAMADLRSLPQSRLNGIAKSLDSREAIRVTTRYQLNESARALLTATLSSLLGRNVSPVFEQNDDVISGLRINVGTVSLEADLADELRFFADIVADGE
jgi:F-type H+-transporting ATPase subunit b